jgi:hypothetical protein
MHDGFSVGWSKGLWFFGPVVCCDLQVRASPWPRRCPLLFLIVLRKEEIVSGIPLEISSLLSTS